MSTIGDFQHDVSPFIEVVIIWQIVQKSSKMFEEVLGGVHILRHTKYHISDEF